MSSTAQMGMNDFIINSSFAQDGDEFVADLGAARSGEEFTQDVEVIDGDFQEMPKVGRSKQKLLVLSLSVVAILGSISLGAIQWVEHKSSTVTGGNTAQFPLEAAGGSVPAESIVLPTEVTSTNVAPVDSTIVESVAAPSTSVPVEPPDIATVGGNSEHSNAGKIKAENSSNIVIPAAPDAVPIPFVKVDEPAEVKSVTAKPSPTAIPHKPAVVKQVQPIQKVRKDEPVANKQAETIPAAEVKPLVAMSANEIGLRFFTDDAISVQGKGDAKPQTFRVGDRMPSGEVIQKLISGSTTVVTDRRVIRISN